MYRQLSLHSLVRSKTESGLFPRVWLDKKAFDFSFSGLKTAVKREIDARIETS
ncbi:MAG: hypothetical protein H6767_07400 [Candidatus Peribacteria bacterium]|nr:MAG: hypothetical protein H6767_07400 [Candidatus Peribacteria bacterium]